MTARRRVTPKAIALVAGLALVLVGAWMWFRDSSLVAIRTVKIVGVSGPHAARIKASLRHTAEGMTTLDFNPAALSKAVSGFSEVRSVSASTSFPHGLTIRVDEQLPVAEVTASGTRIVVASDGTLLRGRPAPARRLPVIPVAVPPVGSRLSEPGAPQAVRVLAAAPWQFLAHIRKATYTSSHGVVASLRNGPAIYFGDMRALRAKWLAAIAVLSSPGAAGAAYIDVTDPQRPAAGVPTGTPTSAAGGTSAPPASSATGTAGASATGTTTSTSGAATNPAG